MPKGEAARESIEALMAVTASLEACKDTDVCIISDNGFIFPYRDATDADKLVYGVVLICRDAQGTETGRMIAQIRAVTTKAEEDESDRRFQEMNR